MAEPITLDFGTAKERKSYTPTNDAANLATLRVWLQKDPALISKEDCFLDKHDGVIDDREEPKRTIASILRADRILKLRVPTKAAPSEVRAFTIVQSGVPDKTQK